MQVAFEAVLVGADGHPIIASILHVGMQEEIQILTSLDIVIKDGVTCKITSSNYTVSHLLRRLIEQAQVEELLQLCRTVHSIRDVYLTVALNRRIVHIVVMLGIVQHLRQVMVVGYAYLNRVRVSLTEISLGIVSQIIAILIPIERI